jgi:hypothetical protein
MSDTQTQYVAPAARDVNKATRCKAKAKAANIFQGQAKAKAKFKAKSRVVKAKVWHTG